MIMHTVAHQEHVNIYSLRKVNPCVRSVLTSFRSETSARLAWCNETRHMSQVTEVMGLNVEYGERGKAYGIILIGSRPVS